MSRLSGRQSWNGVGTSLVLFMCCVLLNVTTSKKQCNRNKEDILLAMPDYKRGSCSIQTWSSGPPRHFLFHFAMFSDVLLWVQRWTVMQKQCPEEPEKNCFSECGDPKFVHSLFGWTVRILLNLESCLLAIINLVLPMYSIAQKLLQSVRYVESVNTISRQKSSYGKTAEMLQTRDFHPSSP